MHKSFPDWYDAVSLHPDSQTLELRWEAVEVLTDELEIAGVPSVIRVFFGLSGADEALEAIRGAAREKDTTFITKGDRNELTVLAGAVIAHSVGTSSAVADAIALAVACVDAQGLRQAPRLQSVVDDTTRYLADKSVRVRRTVESPVTDLDAAALTKLAASNALDVVLNELITEHTKHTKSINSSFEKMRRRQREESDILWWLFSEYTHDGSKAFSEMTIPEACVWGARDLADLTLFLPGPIAAPAFLQRMLRLVKAKLPSNVKISESVDACDIGWKRKLIAALPERQLPDLCPMLFAIAKSVEVGGSTAWTAAFESATGFAAQAKLAPVSLTLQVYNETLLLRALTAKG